MLSFVLFSRWGVLQVWVQSLSYWNRNKAEESGKRLWSLRLTTHTEDTLAEAEDARLLQFCSSPLRIGHYRGEKGNWHTEKDRKVNVLSVTGMSTLKIQHLGLETANHLTSEVRISRFIHAVQWLHVASGKQQSMLYSLSFNPEDRDPGEAALWDAKMAKEHV